MSLGVKSQMKKLVRKSSVAINKMLLAIIPISGLLIAFAYGKSDRGGWAVAGAVCFVVYFTLLYRDYFFQMFNNEAGKYIEITEHGLKLVEPETNYQALIRFDEINEVKIFNANDSVRKLDLYLSNSQKVRISGYEGLTQLAEILRDMSGINLIET